eukprot:gnl/Dysnectes_brevis/2354_a2779_862.p1 GENE.gnl/Dysnectes_brevis/2354_a2779_862~~gnl/Dysnectes_brevis/2354_a2779_862.p1  ORF type:complete len:393 (+),score=98.13 gnl/Dysnectes_brevis/2354_a2779_862:14-1192(+)
MDSQYCIITSDLFFYFFTSFKMMKLIKVESRRCLSVLDGAIQVLERIVKITPPLFQMGIDLDSVFGVELVLTMRKYHQTRTHLENLRAELTSVKAAGFKARLKSIQKKIEQANEHFKRATKQLVIKLAEEDQFLQKLASLGPVPDQTTLGDPEEFAKLDDLTAVLAQLRESTQVQMSTTAEEQRSRKADIGALEQRQKHATAQLQSLQREYELVSRQSSSELSKADERALALRDRISKETLRGTAALKHLQDATAHRNTSSETSHTTRMAELEKAVGSIESRLSELTTSNRTADAEAQKARRRTELQVRSWVEKYDEEMISLDDTRFMLTHQINENRSKIEELEREVAVYEEYRAKRDADEEERLGDIEEKEKAWHLDPTVLQPPPKETGPV